MSGPRSWRNPYPVMVVSGTQEYLRGREVRKATQAATAAGRRVVRVAAGDEGTLREILSGGFLFSDPALAVVESAVKRKKRGAPPSEEATTPWSDNAVAMVVEHGSASSTDVALVVHHADDPGATTFAGKVLAGLPNAKGRHISFQAPKPWDERKYAVKFFTTEVKALGKTVDETLAEAIVRQTGTELGSLSFDALKVSMLLDADGRTEVRKEDLAGILSPTGAEDWQVLKDAVAGRNVKAVVRVLSEIRAGPGGDSVVRVGVILTRTVTQWLHAAALVEQGVPEEEAAARLKMHPFPFSKNVLPAARRWGRKDLTTLLAGIAEAGEARRGFMNPWIVLESALILACQGGG